VDVAAHSATGDIGSADEGPELVEQLVLDTRARRDQVEIRHGSQFRRHETAGSRQVSLDEVRQALGQGLISDQGAPVAHRCRRPAGREAARFLT
jgi:hypothetical protein